MIEVKLYTRKSCKLCEQVSMDLLSLQSAVPHHLAVIDIDADPALSSRFDSQVPVVEVGPYTLKAPITRQELEIALKATQRGAEQDIAIQNKVVDAANYVWTRADRFSYWLSRHYLAVLNVIVLIYLGLPVLAPVLMKAKITGPAYMIYRAYGYMCHQLAFRSWFLFGEQSAYPRAAADVQGLIPFAQATGINDNDLISARNFLGNEQLGYKIALCQRDVSIYGAILVFGLLYAAGGRRIKQLPWYMWVLIGLAPIGLDGFSQLISQPPLSLIPYRESTPFLRFFTGALFGFATAWFGYPMVEESMAESLRYLTLKLEAIKRRKEAISTS